MLVETNDQGSSPGKTRNNVGKRVKSQNKASWIPPKDCRAPDGEMYCTGCEVIIDNCNICKCRNNRLEDCKKTCPDCEFGKVKEGDTYLLGDHRFGGWNYDTGLTYSGNPIRDGSYLT